MRGEHRGIHAGEWQAAEGKGMERGSVGGGLDGEEGGGDVGNGMCWGDTGVGWRRGQRAAALVAERLAAGVGRGLRVQG